MLGCGLAHSSAKDRGVGTPFSMFDPGTLLPDEEQGQKLTIVVYILKELD